MSDHSSSRDSFPFNQPVLWHPNKEWIRESNLRWFMDRYGISGIDELQARSITDIEWFWDAVLKDLGIEFYEPYSEIVDLAEGIQFPTWCVGGRMNIVHNCLDKWASSDRKDKVAIRWEGESGRTRTLTYAELDKEVSRCTNALRDHGIEKGDGVALFMPMTPEIVIAFLAIAKIGGVILPLFSGYGAGAVATRLQDASARAVFVADGFFRRGRTIPMKPVLDEALEECPSVEKVFVFQYAGTADIAWRQGRDVWWHDALRDQPDSSPTEQTLAEDPVMLLYTSGTTGKPKGAVHTHCGFPIKAAQDMYHSMDLKPGEVMYWMSDMGWMMGPWLVFGTLAIGASMVLYDGAPDFPDIDRLWKITSQHAVTHLGVSPTLIRALAVHGEEPVRRHDLSRLRAVGSTGSPWDPESWKWLFRHVLESRKPILNYSGGTEISGGILCGNFFKPLKPCSFSGPVPGMDVDVVDSAGRSIRGEVGELVIRKPWIGMTRGFWKDRERYLETYWSRIEDVWVHGDFAAVDEDGLWYILGRSDDTVNIAGKRVGPAEIEAIVNAHDNVAEVAAVGVPHEVKGQEVVVFTVLKDAVTASEELRDELMALVVESLGKPLKPREIRFVTSLPKTRNAKVMRRVIRAAFLNEDLGDISSLEDPSTVDAIRESA